MGKVEAVQAGSPHHNAGTGAICGAGFPPAPSSVAAYFDIDGTLAATHSVAPLIWYRRRRGLLADRVWAASLLLRVPWWVLLYRLDSSAGNRAIYSSYRGIDAAMARTDARACFEECVKPRILPAALERIGALRRQGAKIVLVTGGLDFIQRPLAEHLDAELIAPGLVEANGVFSGELTRAPLTGAAKYVAVCKHATQCGIDLSASHAFGNEYGDLNMLHAVGHPVAVRPDMRLRKAAARLGWEIAEW